jgi:diaminohydroxyphosphoribosylaminopyrimidine deaminase/5-amino-6-(5-phosphoribosylamino)uracil reductase
MNHEFYMQMALDLAMKGWPAVAPNPMVGCLIVCNNDIVSSGYHKNYGDSHAEVNAINELPNNINPADCIIYVTLEPCSHYGKTPPCADLIIKKGFKKIIICNQDPNPLVLGQGIEKLKNAGIDVLKGVLEQKGRDLNKRFFTFYEKKRPYIILKWAQTADGFISRTPIPQNRLDNLITGNEAQKFSHNLRANEKAIMVGKYTVLNDNPQLTARHVKGNNPIRLIIDKDLSVPKNFNIYDNSANTIVFNQLKDSKEGNVTFVKLNFIENLLSQIIESLFNLKIQSLIVEGGERLLTSFINEKLYDEILVFQNPVLKFEKGIKSPKIKLKQEFELVGTDRLYKLP